jgi:hypothetical protein
MEGENKKHGFFMLAEMLLIIVGITSALQLDNWNQNSTNRRSEKVLLEQLHVEFSQVRNTIDSQIETIERKDKILFKLYKSCGLEKQEYPPDGVLNWFAKSITINELVLFQGVLEDAINTGSLGLIENDSLRIELYSWKNGVLSTQNSMNATNNDVGVFLREIYHHVSFRNYDDHYYPEVGLGRSEFEYNPNDLFNDMYFENVIGILYFRNKSIAKKVEEELVKPLENIQSLIESELNKTDSR